MITDFSEKYMTSEKDKMISIRVARLCSGLTANYVAQTIAISTRKLLEYERNPDTLPLRTAIKLLKLYRFPIDSIQFSNGDELHV